MNLLSSVMIFVIAADYRILLHAHRSTSSYWSKYLPEQRDCGQPDVQPRLVDSRTVGGSESVPGSSPWMVQLNEFGSIPFCGASIISSQWLLTAAHCFVGKSINRRSYYLTPCGFVKAVIGRHKTLRDPIEYPEFSKLDSEAGEQLITLEKFVLHPKFNKDTYENDIALVKLVEPIEFSDKAKPICLPLPNIKYRTSAKCIATGWGDNFANITEKNGEFKVVMSKGSEKPGSLNQVFLPLLSKTDCQRTSITSMKINTKYQLCAGALGKDTCKGDSGGPLACKPSPYYNRWYAFGITSFGEENKCGQGKPGVYTRVITYLKWIKDVVRGKTKYTGMGACVFPGK